MELDLATLDLPNPQVVVDDAEVAKFKEDGFVLPKFGLSAEDAAWMRETVEEVVAKNDHCTGIVRMPHLPKDREGQIEGLIDGDKLFKIAIHPTILAAARRLVGPNIIMWGGEIFAKAPNIGARTPWHQDCYTPCVTAGPGRQVPMSAMVWIAVDDVDPTNGSLSFIPKSGRNGKIAHDQFNKTVKDLLNFEADLSGLDVRGAEYSTMKSGNFSIHDFFVVHGASPNTSGRRRLGLTFHYMSASDLYDRSFGDAPASGGHAFPTPVSRRPMWLVLGENQVPENDFVVGHQNLEDLDAMAEENRIRLNQLLNGKA